MQVTLQLWVCDQVGVDYDATASYIAASNWTAPDGIQFDADNATLSGDADAVWAAFRSLAAAVAKCTHGTDFDGNEIDASPPTLTACPFPDRLSWAYGCGKFLAQQLSTEHETWASFIAELPALGKELDELWAEDLAAEALQSLLLRCGDRFAGNDAAAAAEDWDDYGFTAATAEPWCEIGVWSAAAAAEFRDVGLTPAQVATAAESLIADDDAEADPIYSVCNGDIDPGVIIDAAEVSA